MRVEAGTFCRRSAIYMACAVQFIKRGVRKPALGCSGSPLAGYRYCQNDYLTLVQQHRGTVLLGGFEASVEHALRFERPGWPASVALFVEY